MQISFIYQMSNMNWIMISFMSLIMLMSMPSKSKKPNFWNQKMKKKSKKMNTW